MILIICGMATLAAPTPSPAFAQPMSVPASSELAEATLSEAVVSGEAPTDDYQPDVSTVGGKIPTAIRDIPQPVKVVDRAVLDAQGATSLPDALRNAA